MTQFKTILEGLLFFGTFFIVPAAIEPIANYIFK